MERVDYVIIGAGIAGITLKHFLRNDRTVLLEADPGRYKIGESIIPEHFRHPELRALLPRMQEMPSYSSKYGTTFVEPGSMVAFPLPRDVAGGAMHITRTEMEQVMLDAWNIEPRVERVIGVDLPRRIVRTDVGEYEVARQILDCSGPSMVLASLLGQTRKLWPVYSTWAYWDIEENDPVRFHDAIQEKGWSQLYFSTGQRRILPQESRDWRPGRSTILTKVADGVWTWQIPLFREKLLSLGVVSREGAVSRAQYEEIARSHVAPNYRLRMRPLDGSSAYNRLHIRNNFARSADVAATDRTILLSDAFAFADPIYSVGTGLAVNKAIEVATILNETGWTPAICEAYCRHYDAVLGSAVAGFEFWYAGKVLQDDTAASIVQSELLAGNTFQSNVTWHYVHALVSADLPPRLYDADPFTVDWQDPELERATENVTAAVRIMLVAQADGSGNGYRLARARPATGGVLLKWTRDSSPDLLLLISVLRPGGRYFRQHGTIGISYLSNQEDFETQVHEGKALVDELLPQIGKRPDDWSELLLKVGTPS